MAKKKRTAGGLKKAGPQITIDKRLVILLVPAIIVVGLVYWFFTKPQLDNQSDARDARTRVETDITRLNAETAKVEDGKGLDLNQLYTKGKEAEALIPAEVAKLQASKDVAAIGESTGMTLRPSIPSGVTPIEELGLRNWSMSVSGTGDRAQVLQLLAAFRSHDGLITVHDPTITTGGEVPVAGQTPAAETPGVGEYTFTATIKVWMAPKGETTPFKVEAPMFEGGITTTTAPG